MKILTYFAAGIGVLALVSVAGLFIAGAMISESQSFTNEVEINASEDRVWEVINDRDRFTEWQDQLKKVEVVDEIHWTEYPKDSPEPLKFMVAADERPDKMEFHYTMGNDFTGHWKGELTPIESGVKLRTTDSYSTDGMLTKILIYAFFDLDSFAKDWNGKLKTRVESLNK
ncbi:MAG: SRPBCC family protein [Pyrinomonadaceae bacterium]